MDAMKSSIVSILALLLAALALFTSLRRSESASPLLQPLSAAPLGLEELRQRVDTVEASLARPEARLATVPAKPVENDRQPVSQEFPDLEALEQRVVRLEQMFGGQEAIARNLGADTDGGLAVLGFLASSMDDSDSPETILEWQAQATDPTSDADAKLRALRALRGQSLEDGSDARDYYVVQSMIDLVATSEDGDVRADVYRQLSGVTEPALLGALIDSLRNDPHARTREEAAETLEDYLPDAEAEAALTWALENDPDKRVRSQAAESLY